MFEILHLTFFNVVKSLEFNLLKPAETVMPQNHCHVNYMSKLKETIFHKTAQQMKLSPCTLTVDETFVCTEVWLNFLQIFFFFLSISCHLILIYKFLHLLDLLLKVVLFTTSGSLDEALGEPCWTASAFWLLHECSVAFFYLIDWLWFFFSSPGDSDIIRSMPDQQQPPQ